MTSEHVGLMLIGILVFVVVAEWLWERRSAAIKEQAREREERRDHRRLLRELQRHD